MIEESDFLEAACVPLEGWHGAGTLERANQLLARQPELAGASVYTAAALGDDGAVRRWLDAEPALTRAAGGPRGWDALTYLCFSRYLRLDRSRSNGFVRAARLLLERGASADTGFRAAGGGLESALYGAAGIARHAELTRLLLEHGADPNDGETPYHAPEGHDDGALHALVESGRLEPGSLTTMLHRKSDWHHHDGMALLLEHGADPNQLSRWGRRALHHALQRDNALPILALLLDRGADPLLPDATGKTAVAIAARMGRPDALDLFAQRGFAVALDGGDALMAACARGDAATARALVAADPTLVARLQAEDGALLADVAGAGNLAAVALMLDLGFDVASRTSRTGHRDDSALHVAVWRARHDVARLLIARGAPLELANGRGETPLAVAVRALVDPGEWTQDSTASVAALLAAGARAGAVAPFPTGAAEVDELLRRHGRA